MEEVSGITESGLEKNFFYVVEANGINVFSFS
jgi:hypothetical protein